MKRWLRVAYKESPKRHSNRLDTVTAAVVPKSYNRIADVGTITIQVTPEIRRTIRYRTGPTKPVRAGRIAIIKTAAPAASGHDFGRL
ncbi:hypothetical protein EVAR_33309_1 [Eumeta japonica]|uniref:Uncharacterized protein n=1 Tax=Eumeta variegata TaxID=151549 RepID=A0A4C1WHU3_EUMVA|nr:hypothetical protein EVAR_33309_1 [Eumeta japonica]